MTTDITELALLVSKAKASVFTLEYISQFEPADIDSDDVDLRFEVDGRDTGTNVSIVDECGQAARVIGALVEALEKAQADGSEYAASERAVAVKNVELQDEIYGLKSRIAELERQNGVLADGVLQYERLFLESRTVKLPPRAPENLACCLDGYEKWLIATTFRDTWNKCLDEVMLRGGSGIKWEAE